MLPTLVSLCTLLLGGAARAQDAPAPDPYAQGTVGQTAYVQPAYVEPGPVVASTPEQPQLSFVEATEGVVAWTTIRGTVDHTLTLVETGKKVGAQVTLPEVHLTFGDLDTVLKVEPARIGLAPGESRTLRLTGVLPAVGGWTGRLVLERAGGHEIVPISVERVIAAALPTLEALAPPVLVRGPAASTLPVQVRISEAGSRPVDVSSLVLTRLLPPGSAASSTASIPTRACWTPGTAPIEGGACAEDGVVGEPVTIASGGSAQWSLAVPVPWGAGAYTGSVQARTLEGDNIPAALFTFHVKHPWYLCLLTVAAGVILSAVLRGWLGQGRVAAVAALPLARLADAIRGLPTGDRIRILLELEVSRLAEDPVGQAGGIEDARRVFDNYLSIGRVRDLLPLLPKLVPDPIERGRLQGEITTLIGRAVDLAALATPPGGTNALVVEAGALYERVRGAADAAVKSGLESLRAGVADARERLGRISDPALAASLEARLAAVSAPLGVTEGAEDAAGQLARLNEARTALGRVAADLDAALPAPNAKMSAAGPGTYETLLNGLGVGVTLPRLRFGAPPVVSERGLKRWIRSVDFAVIGVVLVLAGVFALYELWWLNDGWGTLGDYLAALAWGFGAHVLGGAAQAGAQGGAQAAA